MLKIFVIFLSLFLVLPQTAFAADVGVQIVNWYEVVLNGLFSWLSPSLPESVTLEVARFWSPVLASIFAVALMCLVAVFSGFSSLKPEKMSDEELLPPSRLNLRGFLEICFNVISSTLSSTIGEKNWTRYAGVLGGTFFILIMSNLSGVIPGFSPATSTMGFAFAAAMVIFVYFNYHGLKEAKFDYIKHLAGPVLWMAPLLFVIELVSLLSRPVSLSLRIYGNITGDHFVFSIFSGLMKDMYIPFIPIPAVFLAFGTFVACLQAFIFMTLSAVYIKLALDSKSHH